MRGGCDTFETEKAMTLNRLLDEKVRNVPGAPSGYPVANGVGSGNDTGGGTDQSHQP
jgi:hypothetical protein